ncbi:hypothetical protein DNK59_17465 [Pseudomonas sp. TKO26]|nr:hypothetical protein DNK62_17465 [Pseudomonas sp. TKO30]PYY86020.1 hypothetical protein DNK61_17460 [Pseudomonas sp. TKO29]PYY88894.1 hypothetical protein DNK59_17465 [Pseudomonas sp. TKO26]PYY99016.1 hypothetical protein DNK60_17455 [Pseudomonas sp. TKO14]
MLLTVVRRVAKPGRYLSDRRTISRWCVRQQGAGGGDVLQKVSSAMASLNVHEVLFTSRVH